MWADFSKFWNSSLLLWYRVWCLRILYFLLASVELYPNSVNSYLQHSPLSWVDFLQCSAPHKLQDNLSQNVIVICRVFMGYSQISVMLTGSYYSPFFGCQNFVHDNSLVFFTPLCQSRGAGFHFWRGPTILKIVLEDNLYRCAHIKLHWKTFHFIPFSPLHFLP